MHTIDLNGPWMMKNCPAGVGESLGWHRSGPPPAESLVSIVPGDVHTTLVAAGLIDDPLYGDNSTRCSWIEREDWWFSREFEVPAEVANGGRIELHFQGLDTDADVWVNGTLVGSFANMYVPADTDVTAIITAGMNRVVVRLDTGVRAYDGKDLRPYNAMAVPSGDTPRMLMRKAQYVFGWDWASRLLTCGIWRGVDLRSFDSVALRDVCIRTTLDEDGRADVEFRVEVENFGTDPIDLETNVELAGPEVHVGQVKGVLPPGVHVLTVTLRVDEPALWWPLGAGTPYLYGASVRISAGGNEVGQRTLKVGVRTVDLRQEALPDGGRSFTFVVNGKPIYCRGANWAPADCLPAMTTATRYRQLLKRAADANLNFLRVNGCTFFEDPVFYETCDELGLMVWQDFLYSCAYYPDEGTAVLESAQREASEGVRALRNHPSLIAWCGNNENQWIHRRQVISGPPAAARCYGEHLYDELLPAVCAELDPTRPYWPSSPWGGQDDENSPLEGDAHLWPLGVGSAWLEAACDYGSYLKDSSRFISEFGILSPSSVASLAKFLPEDHRSPGRQFWEHHKNTADAGWVAAAVEKYWRPQEPMRLEEYVWIAQLLQGYAYKAAIEHWRRRKFATSGISFWSFNDSWGASTGWSVVDHYGRPKSSYHAVQRAYAPLTAFACVVGDQVEYWIVNDTNESVRGTAEHGLVSLPDSRYESDVTVVDVAPNAALRVHASLMERAVLEERGRWAAFCRLRVEGEVRSENSSLLCGLDLREIVVPEPKITVEFDEAGVILTASSFCWQVHIAVPEGVQASENDLDLLPGMRHRVALSGPTSLFDQVRVFTFRHGTGFGDQWVATEVGVLTIAGVRSHG